MAEERGNAGGFSLRAGAPWGSRGFPGHRLDELQTLVATGPYEGWAARPLHLPNVETPGPRVGRRPKIDLPAWDSQGTITSEQAQESDDLIAEAAEGGFDILAWYQSYRSGWQWGAFLREDAIVGLSREFGRAAPHLTQAELQTAAANHAPHADLATHCAAFTGSLTPCFACDRSVAPILVGQKSTIEFISIGPPLRHQRVHEIFEASVVQAFDDVHHLVNNDVLQTLGSFLC